MEKSESLSNLAKALCEAQKTALFALTDAKNPFFKSTYSTLASVWDAARKPLTNNGLSVVQTTDTTESGVIIETTLLHVSGEYMTGKLLMKPEKDTPQGFGSAITYGRRYALAAIIGISPEDDDGEAVMNRKKDRIKETADELINELQETTSVSHKDNWKKKHLSEILALDKTNRERVIAAGVKHTEKLNTEFKERLGEEIDGIEDICTAYPELFAKAKKAAGLETIETLAHCKKFMDAYGALEGDVVFHGGGGYS